MRGLVETFSAAGRPAQLTLDPRLTERSFPPEISTTVHRLVQEALTNCRAGGETMLYPSPGGSGRIHSRAL
ncbi:hypothetical protein AB0952_22165 [Streptomyces caniferus]|uniref:hypothetical protein n=1 Tax=Streptomyces caniferus TaxID=285557 RepID=UPI00340D2E64